MEIVIDGYLHKVVYIEYTNGLPHSVITKRFIPVAVKKPYWRLYEWDFFANNGDTDDIRAYNSGSGPGRIAAPHWADGYTGKYWISDDLKLKGTVKNGERLQKPLLLPGYLDNNFINPFDVAEITNVHEYCDKCGHASTEFCTEHKYDAEDGSVRYISDDTSAE